MYEQPDGIPAEPPGHVPPPPPYPPSPASGYPPPGYPSAQQRQQQPPGAQWYPSATPGYAPPPSARRSRVGLWVALGVVGVLLVGGMAYGLTAGSGVPSGQGLPAPAPPGPAGGGAAPVGGGGGSGQQAPGGVSRPLATISLPDTFLGLVRNDDDEAAQLLRQMDPAEQQGSPVRAESTVYVSGETGEAVITVSTHEADEGFSDEAIRQSMGRFWAPVASPYMRITYGTVSTVDPGPFGGILQCAQSVIETDSPDIFGNRISQGVKCAWRDVNTSGMLMFGEAATGQSVARGADAARKFRAAAESRR